VPALASELPRVNGWSIARRGGDRTPDRTQRLLNHASWDTFAAMSVVRRFAVTGLEEAAWRGRRGGMVIGATDETGQEKAGEATAGVKRHYLGCAGKVANGITTVHLSYVRDKTGHALIGARQWIPAEHLADLVKSLLMGCRWIFSSAPRASWPSTSAPTPPPTASGPTSTAGTRSTAAAQLREHLSGRGGAPGAGGYDGVPAEAG
jgi:DDE superfamily endonuclease